MASSHEIQAQAADLVSPPGLTDIHVGGQYSIAKANIIKSTVSQANFLAQTMRACAIYFSNL